MYTGVVSGGGGGIQTELLDEVSGQGVLLVVGVSGLGGGV